MIIGVPLALSLIISSRDISREGFLLTNTVADLVSNGTWSWPQSWLLKAPDLGLITCPTLVSSVADLWQWRDQNGNISTFSVAKAWEAIRSRGMDLIPSVLQDILLYLLPMGDKRMVKSVFGKLIMAASAYFIWMERNNRTFKNTSRSLEEIRDLIMVMVRLKLISFRLKNTNCLDAWEVLRRSGCSSKKIQVRVVLFFLPQGFSNVVFLGNVFKEAISLEGVSPVRVAHQYSGLEVL
nr:hypothetical protein [Tanacetum cinerariifolium]